MHYAKCTTLIGHVAVYMVRGVGSSLALVRQIPSSSLPSPSLPPIPFLSPFVVVGPSFFPSTLHPSPSLHFRLPSFRSRRLKSS